MNEETDEISAQPLIAYLQANGPQRLAKCAKVLGLPSTQDLSLLALAMKGSGLFRQRKGREGLRVWTLVAE